MIFWKENYEYILNILKKESGIVVLVCYQSTISAGIHSRPLNRGSVSILVHQALGYGQINRTVVSSLSHLD